MAVKNPNHRVKSYKKYRCFLEQQHSSLTGKREKEKKKKRKSLSPVKPPRRVKKLWKPVECPRTESSRAYRGVFRHIIDTGLITFLGEMSGQRSDITLPLDSYRANSFALSFGMALLDRYRRFLQSGPPRSRNGESLNWRFRSRIISRVSRWPPSILSSLRLRILGSKSL